ncbi:MAG: carboxymuconolactone decarboxylase family protein [Actinomycetaceae bacterium]|nr:carboxymuconolactone decarboxylase family protein [Arcanobacterium sp.]MDD7505020.1 carboxymuconolactone decarboxylase family protein [Actinomycetaceae bacterium]MDY6143733.1 carboxymuconolactone decarboxylase family protein [Arcanobacterium sp.]
MADNREPTPEEIDAIPHLDREFPEVAKAFNQASVLVRKAYKEVGLGVDLVELITVRASQINRCGTCLSVHIPRALKAGVPQRKIDFLPAWREIDGLYDEREKSALELCEQLTILPHGQANNAAALQALNYFSKPQIAALEYAILNINLHNRISIASHHPLREAQ